MERQHRLDAWHLPRTSCVDFHGKISVLEEMESKALGRGDTFLTILRNSNRLNHDENENSYDLCDCSSAQRPRRCPEAFWKFPVTINRREQ